jgi:hypothetical protein
MAQLACWSCGNVSNKIVGYKPAVYRVPSGKHTKNYVKSQFFMGKFTINAIFNSYVCLPEGKAQWGYNPYSCGETHR